VSGFYFSPFFGRVSGTPECACRREESKIGRRRAHNIEPVLGATYGAIGNPYRAPGGFVILQRTNTALAIAACETAPVRVDCSALHRVPLFHVGGFS
jgi:hypothetical protein